MEEGRNPPERQGACAKRMKRAKELVGQLPLKGR